MQSRVSEPRESVYSIWMRSSRGSAGCGEPLEARDNGRLLV